MRRVREVGLGDLGVRLDAQVPHIDLAIEGSAADECLRANQGAAMEP